MSPKWVGRPKAEKRAAALLEDQGISDLPIPVEEISEHLGLEVFYETLPTETSSVLIRQPDGRRVIGVNARHAPRRQRFSLAHEIGHALLHFPEEAPTDGEAVVSRPLEVLFRDGVAGQGTSRVEIDANAFAAALLMPEQLVWARFHRRWQTDVSRRVDDVIDDLADEFDVSAQAMRYRLVNLGLVDPA
jgi:Zn-dependent peptidase ImmA (M78 family)